MLQPPLPLRRSRANVLFSLFRESQSQAPPLRIGLLLDTAVVPACFAEIVDHIAASNFARIELLIYNQDELKKAAAAPAGRSRLGKILDLLRDGKRRRTLLFSLYERWDGRNTLPSHDPVANVDCSKRFEHIESISVTPVSKRFVHRFPPDALESIRARNLDVLIRFGFNILRGEILTAAKYGVWSYHHGDNDYYRGGPAYFWEVVEANPISGAILQILTEQLDAGRVLYKGLFGSYPGISQSRNRVQPYWGSSTFMIQKLRELHQNGWEAIERGMVPPAPYLGKRKIYVAPSNAEMLRWLGPLAVRKTFQRLTRKPVVNHWRLAIRAGAQTLPDLSGFRPIESPRDHFYADPFLVEQDGKPWVFFEDFKYSTGRGAIACAQVQDGKMGPSTPVLERPYHLSYPMIFRDSGALYMIPETGANKTVELYRCVSFPHHWELEKELFQAKAVDTTVWIEDGLYWFFVTFQEPRGSAVQLWLFYANSLTGKWIPHPRNPISTDVRSSRGAGAMFRRHGKLYRPSQDCSRTYGYSFTLNEVLALNTHDYRERPGVTVEPTWAPGLIATHTYACVGQVEIIDGCAPVPKESIEPIR